MISSQDSTYKKMMIWKVEQTQKEKTFIHQLGVRKVCSTGLHGGSYSVWSFDQQRGWLLPNHDDFASRPFPWTPALEIYVFFIRKLNSFAPRQLLVRATYLPGDRSDFNLRISASPNTDRGLALFSHCSQKGWLELNSKVNCPRAYI